jgi:ABC-type multidrug transport system fused ATPase/permease subunit
MKSETEETYFDLGLFCMFIGAVLCLISAGFGYIIIFLVAAGFTFVGAILFFATLAIALWRELKKYIIKEEDRRRELQKSLDRLDEYQEEKQSKKESEEQKEEEYKREKQTKKEGNVRIGIRIAKGIIQGIYFFFMTIALFVIGSISVLYGLCKWFFIYLFTSCRAMYLKEKNKPQIKVRCKNRNNKHE